MSKLSLTAALIAVLAAASAATALWGLFLRGESSRKLQNRIALNIGACWVMSAVYLVAWWGGFFTSVVLFVIISMLAMREYLTVIETRRADHRTLIWAFLILTPLQYLLIGLRWYGLFSIFIPVYGFMIVTARAAAAGDYEKFLERTAKVHWGLMTCVFLLSHAPALLTLSIPGFEGREDLLFFFLIAVTEAADAFQFLIGKSFGRLAIAPTVSPNKTVEGLAGGILCSAFAAALLSGLTPFPLWLSAVVGAFLCLFGFCGGLCMSALKRDQGCKDFGTLIPGHGGMLDRIDSLCFTAPLFFHFVRYFYT